MGSTDNLSFRPLSLEDYDNGYLECLANLTIVGDISKAQFQERLELVQRSPEIFKHMVYVRDDGKVIAAGTLVVEPKFIRSCGSTGHLEDIVVHPCSQGLGLGKLMISALTTMAKDAGCYKVTLECADDNLPFYHKCGFARKGNQMCIYFS